MPLKAINPAQYDITAFVDVLKTGKARKAFQAALRKGKSPTLSLTAAVSASLVSAAAKEEEIDPLAGLVAVDDLSAFGEDCLPGASYALDETHDHDSANADGVHAGHHGRASYLADPFASKFDNIYAREHQGHGDHDQMTARHGNHAGAGHHDAASHVAGDAHANLHGAHHSAGHQHSNAGHSALHHPSAGHSGDGHDNAGHEEAGHDQHAAGRHMSDHSSEEHDDLHGAHAGHGNHSSQALSAGGTEHGDHARHDDPETGDAIIDLDQAIGALAAGHEHDTPVDEAADEHTHHHPTLAELDTPPADDLAAAQTLPVI